MNLVNLVILTFLFLIVGSSVYGLILAFKASIILGIILLIAEPGPAIFGLLGIFGHPEVAQRITAWLHLPF